MYVSIRCVLSIAWTGQPHARHLCIIMPVVILSIVYGYQRYAAGVRPNMYRDACQMQTNQFHSTRMGKSSKRRRTLYSNTRARHRLRVWKSTPSSDGTARVTSYRTIFFFINACETRVASLFTGIENAPKLNLTQHDVNIVTVCVARWRCTPLSRPRRRRLKNFMS